MRKEFSPTPKKGGPTKGLLIGKQESSGGECFPRIDLLATGGGGTCFCEGKKKDQWPGHPNMWVWGEKLGKGTAQTSSIKLYLIAFCSGKKIGPLSFTQKRGVNVERQTKKKIVCKKGTQISGQNQKVSKKKKKGYCENKRGKKKKRRGGFGPCGLPRKETRSNMFFGGKDAWGRGATLSHHEKGGSS